MASCPASTAENGCLSEVNEKALKKKKSDLVVWDKKIFLLSN